MPPDSTVMGKAWVTLLTRSSYLPGVLTLAYTLKLHATQYPLLVLTTPALPEPCLRALTLESIHNPLLIIHPVSPLLPAPHHKITLIASRFEDTWTKLRVFSLTDYTTLVFLDADITIYRNMDSVFETRLPSPDWLAANHACVCNLDKDSWAPADWTAANCAYTPLHHPTALTSPTPVPSSEDPDAKSTHRILNSGMFLFHPSPSLWSTMLHYFESSTLLSTYKFPDQDFLADFFADKWMSLGWQYNALKTMRYWHESMWRDDEVCGLHYIVDKPWARRIAQDGVAGHLGRDGVTHGWWWSVWDQWRGESEGEKELLEIAEALVPGALDEEGDRKQCQENQERSFPVPVPAHPSSDEPDEENKGKKEEHSFGEGKRSGSFGPVIRERRPGEHGDIFPIKLPKS